MSFSFFFGVNYSFKGALRAL